MAALADLPVRGPVSPWLSAPGLRVPTFASIPEWHDTLADEAIDFLRTDCKFAPDPQQELGLRIALARDKLGRSAAFSLTVIAGRQMIKTGLWKMLTLVWLYLLEEPLVTWSAHRADTSMEAQADLEKLIEAAPALDRATRRFGHANGAEAIETTSRCKVQFRTRTKTGGKGLSANKVILDEAFALQPNHMGSLVPTLTAMPDPQLFYGSSAAMEDSVVLHEKIKQGRPGDERDWVTDQPQHRVIESGGAAYLEWCAPPPEITCDAGAKCTHGKTAVGCGCDKDRWILMANPAVALPEQERRLHTPGGPRSTLRYVHNERGELPDDEYARERMGWHEKPRAGSSQIPMTLWYNPCADKNSRVASAIALAIAVSWDKSMAAIALAGWRQDGLPHGELVEHLPGTGWLMDRLLGIVDRQDPCCLVMDPRGPAGGFERQLRLGQILPDGERKNQFVTVPKNADGPPKLLPGQRILMVVSSVEDAQACNMLADRVLEGTFRHPDQGPLNKAVRDARSRPVGQSWAWDEQAGVDITPVKAVTLAQIGLATFGAKPSLTPFALV